MTSGDVFEAIIGLEVHVQLSTKSKAFSPDPASSSRTPNEQIDIVSLAHPGTLPVLNEAVVDCAVLAGLAMNCTIAGQSVLARKHYFYPDLPKGYQISQYDQPICSDGWLDVDDRRIRINRIHVEEDAGKSLHDRTPDVSLIDFNRCGVPLLEIVSEPDIRLAAEASSFMKQIHSIVTYLGICDGNMQDGSLRCDANVSVRHKGSNEFGAKVEIKNLNSFRFVEQSLRYEIARQTERLVQGGEVVVETRLWDDDALETTVMRGKEEASDYRYMDDPDLPPIIVTPERIDRLRNRMPMLAGDRTSRYVEEFGLPEKHSKTLANDREVSDYFEQVVRLAIDRFPSMSEKKVAGAVANVFLSHVLRRIKEFGQHDTTAWMISADRLADAVLLKLDGSVSSTGFSKLLDVLYLEKGSPVDLAKDLKLLQISSEELLLPAVQEVVDNHPEQVLALINGKESLMGFFVGQVMRSFDGAPNPEVVRDLIKREINARDND